MIGPHKLTEIRKLTVNPQNLRRSPCGHAKFKSFNLNMRKKIFMSVHGNERALRPALNNMAFIHFQYLIIIRPFLWKWEDHLVVLCN